MADLTELNPLNVVNLPSYRVSELTDGSFVICKVIERYCGTDFCGRIILLRAGYVYRLVFLLVKALQKIGIAYFIERVEVENGN